MKKFLRENFVLAAGICLPLILVIIFWLATFIPTLLVEPPQYDFLYTAQNYNNSNSTNLAVQIDAVDNSVRIRAAARWSDENFNRYNSPKIYRFDSKTGKSVEISYADAIAKQVPNEFYSCNKPSSDHNQSQATEPNTATSGGDCPNNKSGNGNDYFTIKLPELENIQLYNSQMAPDGYIVEYGGYNRQSLFSDVFYNSRSYSHFRITKNGRSYAINNNAQGYSYDYGNIKFLGWIRKD